MEGRKRVLRIGLLIGLLIGGMPPAATGQPAAQQRHYVAYRTPAPLHIDGRLDEAAWRAAPWTDAFVDIQGDARPRPAWTTQAQMLWDDTHLYIAATLEEPDLWATLTTRDAVLFHDNDFEVFIDPDGDTHWYYELEVNALGTVWDLLLTRPYRNQGRAIDAWDIQGLQIAVYLDGTLNTPGDRDRGWTVELALPWTVLEEAAAHRGPPRSGEQWRVNFSRVQWQLAVEDGQYVKKIDPATGKPYAENNWVWSPQGVVNMHLPEHWGWVQFSDVVAGQGTAAFVPDPNEAVRQALRRLHDRQQAYHEAHGRYATDLDDLDAGALSVPGLDFAPVLHTTASLYEITAPGFDGATLHIRHDGKVWRTD